MHPLVPVVLADIGVPVKVNDANIAVDMWSQSPNVRVPYRMIATKDDGKDTSFVNIANRFGDLVKTLLNVRRYHAHGSDINHGERFHQVDA
jgi:hypothetical protein